MRKKTAAVDLDNDNVDTSVLLKAISKKVDKPLHEIVATVKKDNIPVSWKKRKCIFYSNLLNRLELLQDGLYRFMKSRTEL